MIVMAHDPGSVNYGFAILEGQILDGKLKYRVRTNGLVPFTIKNLKDQDIRRKQRIKYQKWCKNIIAEYGVERLIGERYQTRGISGPTIECVNMMLGVLQTMKVPDTLVTAATWKNAVTRSGVDLKAKYKYAMVTPHQLDACLMGLYELHRIAGLKDYGTSLEEDSIDKLIEQIERTSREPLKKRMMRRTS